MKNILLLLLLSIPLCVSSQSKSQKALVQKLEDYKAQELFKIEKSDVVVSRVIEDLDGDKSALYLKAKEFFSEHYDNPLDIIEIDDKTAGLILGKAYMRVASLNTLFDQTIIGTDYTLRVDIKDGRVRASCSASKWVCESDDVGVSYKPILYYEPFTKKRFMSKFYHIEIMIRLVDYANSLIDELEASVRKENDDW